MNLDLVRRLGAVIETLHAVVYFAPEPLAAYEALGLRGYWRGYFASRAGALGAVGPDEVTRLFGGFAPPFVARAVPQVWTIASPRSVVEARRQGAATALSRVLGGESAALLAPVVDRLDLTDRPMAGAERSAGRPDDPVAAMWHDCTVLREFRGDGHLQVLAAHRLVWPVPHLLAADRVDPRQQDYRGWSDEEWAAAATTAAGIDPRLPEVIERETDERAAAAYRGVAVDELLYHLEPLAVRVAESGTIPYPNAMGLLPL